MNDSLEPIRDDELEAYFDGLMNEADRAAFAEMLRVDPVRRRQADLQARIDDALSRIYSVQQPSHEQLSEALAAVLHGDAATIDGDAQQAQNLSSAAVSTTSNRPASARRARAAWAAAGLAAAAAIGWVLASLIGNQPDATAPYFAARPLVDVYHDAIASGFEPSYECREPERFAATFRDRQGVPLQLLAMPARMKMLGLSYVGGLSRHTTAMLCRVDDQPVMVFVDRAEDDQLDAAVSHDAAVHVFRQERDGLVFYEVTPFETPRVTPLLAPTDA